MTASHATCMQSASPVGCTLHAQVMQVQSPESRVHKNRAQDDLPTPVSAYSPACDQDQLSTSVSNTRATAPHPRAQPW